MNFFDFREEVDESRGNAISDPDKAAARTSIPQQRLPEAVKSAGWRFLDVAGQFVPGVRPRELVIGVAPWNPAELSLNAPTQFLTVVEDFCDRSGGVILGWGA